MISVWLAVDAPTKAQCTDSKPSCSRNPTHATPLLGSRRTPGTAASSPSPTNPENASKRACCPAGQSRSASVPRSAVGLGLGGLDGRGCTTSATADRATARRDPHWVALSPPRTLWVEGVCAHPFMPWEQVLWTLGPRQPPRSPGPESSHVASRVIDALALAGTPHDARPSRIGTVLPSGGALEPRPREDTSA
jgi:hypothetical protein